MKLIDVETAMERPIVLDQLELIRLRNTSPAFKGELQLIKTEPHQLHMTWVHKDATATLQADLKNHNFTVSHGDGFDDETIMSF